MKRFLPIVLILIFATVLVQAEDDMGNVNDPGENDRANACYDDGSLAYKCDTDWEWECGWYLIRFEYDSLSRDNFPDWCASLLPPIEENSTEVEGCRPHLGSYLYFGSGNYLASGAPTYSDARCTNAYSNINSDLVYAPGGSTEATAICVANSSHTDSGYIGENIHYCRN